MTRNEAYQALADLITKGFLAMGVEMAGKPYIFKTINDKEYQLARLYARNESEFNLWYFAFSTFMIDDICVLGDTRGSLIRDIKEFFANTPSPLMVHTMEALTKLRMTSFEVLKFLEGFSYTNMSRNTWRAISGSPCRPEFTGIPGTDSIGLCAHQESWVRINRMLDDEETYNREFSNALLIASATNPKGVRSLRSRYDMNVENAKTRREKLAVDGSREAKKAWTPDGWAASTDTTEDLLAELDRQISGVKDKHDIFMENYMKNLKERAMSKERAVAKKIEELREKNADMPMIEGSQRVLTSEEMQELMNKRGRPKYVAALKSEEHVNPEDKKRFINKIGARILTPKVN